MENFLFPVFDTARGIAERSHFVHTERSEGLPWDAWGLAWAIALVGGALGWFMYRSYFPKNAGQPAPAPLAALRTFAQNKFYVDELYELIIIKPVKLGSWLFYTVIDKLMIDTIAVRGTAWLTARLGSGLRYFQSGDAQSYAAVMAFALVVGIVLAMMKVWGGVP